MEQAGTVEVLAAQVHTVTLIMVVEVVGHLTLIHLVQMLSIPKATKMELDI